MAAVFPIFEGSRLPARLDPGASAALDGGVFVQPSAAWQDSGPALSSTKVGGVAMTVDQCAAAEKALGVLQDDAAIGGDCVVLMGPLVVPVTGGGVIAIGAEVEVDADGAVVTLAAGVAVGLALTAGTDGNPLYVKLY